MRVYKDPDEIMGCVTCANQDLGDRGMHDCTEGVRYGDYLYRAEKEKAEYDKLHPRLRIRATYEFEVEAATYDVAYKRAETVKIYGAYPPLKLVSVEGVR